MGRHQREGPDTQYRPAPRRETPRERRGRGAPHEDDRYGRTTRRETHDGEPLEGDSTSRTLPLDTYKLLRETKCTRLRDLLPLRGKDRGRKTRRRDGE